MPLYATDLTFDECKASSSMEPRATFGGDETNAVKRQGGLKARDQKS